MAEQQTHDSLTTLQAMLDSVMVETGKALRAARKDGRGPHVQAREPPARMSESIRTFHQALDSLENDIVSAKSVLQRDLRQIRESSGQVTTPSQGTLQPVAPPMQVSQTPVPQPVDAQTKSPMVIDLDSSPTANNSPVAIKAEPVPSSTAQSNGAINGMSNGHTPQGPSAGFKLETAAPMIVQEAPMEEAPMEEAVMAPGNTAGSALGMSQEVTSGTANNNISATDGGSEAAFTNMTFSLAPPNEEAPMSANPQGQTFDMSGFAPADSGNDMMAMDSINLNNDNNGQGTASGETSGAQAEGTSTGSGNGDNANGGSLDDFDWSLDVPDTGGGGDGLDFDFSIGDEDTFNTLMNERDGEIGAMDQGAFDADPFGVDKQDGS